MKIAYFTDTFTPNINGIVTSILNSSKRLAARNHKIFIFTVRPKNEKRKTKRLSKNVRVIYYEGTGLLHYPDFQIVRPDILRTFLQIKKIRPDIIHIHTPTFLGWVALFAASMYDIPVVGTYHTFLPEFLQYVRLPKIKHSDTAKKLTWAYTRKFYNRCSIITTPSLAMKQELEKHGIKKKILFISNGVNLKRFKPVHARKTGFTILHIGRISYEKNIDILLKAFKILLKNVPKARLIIGGGGPELDKLKTLAKTLGVGKKVKFLGVIPNDQLPKVYSSADVFVTASTIETEGLVILEAMACGLPIVGVDALAVPYIVKHGKNGLVARPGNTRQIAKFIKELLDDKEMRDAFGKESLKIAKGFSLTRIINNIEKVYNSLVS